jgi:aminoglycoside phosphotransferase family enzyme/predicted kinase
MDQAETIAFLSDPATYGPGCETVELHETHGALVFLAGDRAYKLKRAVRYPYMDYSTPALREAMCKAELRVNRRTAPELYLSAEPVVRMPTGELHLGAVEGEGIPVDWVVVMQRFAQADLMEEQRKRGTLNVGVMRTLGETIARFHASAEICPQWGGAGGIERVIEENLRMFRQFEGRPFDPATIAEYRDKALASLHGFAHTLEARRRDGRVRRCHGDLHLNNVCLIDGAPLIFDAIEFNDDFSCIDVYFDLAFMLMDLHRHGLGGFANALFNRYVEISGDLGLEPLPLFLSSRAAIRAHVSAASAERESPAGQAKRLHEAAGLLTLSLQLLEQGTPILVAIGGFSGSGKSTLAAALAPSLGRAPGAVVLRSDVIRKRLFGVSETVRLPQEAYGVENTRRVYCEMTEAAAALLAAGQSVVADAVFGEASECAAIRAAASQSKTMFRGLWLDAPPESLSRRIAGRTGDASDATVDVLRRQIATLDRPEDWQALDASGPIAAVAAAARRALDDLPSTGA